METQAITTQWQLPHDNSQAQIKMHTSTQHSVDNSVKRTMGCTKQRIVRTRREPGTRVYAGISAAAPIIPTTKPHAITTLRTPNDMAETTVLSNTANLPSQPVHQPPGATKPVDKTHWPMQPEIKDPCTAGPNLTTLTPNQKHLAFPGQTLKSHDIYIHPGYKMVSRLNSIHADNDSHLQPDIIDKNKDENQHELDPTPTLHSPSNRIHPMDIAAITVRPVYGNIHVRTTDITNDDQRTPLFALSQPTKPIPAHSRQPPSPRT